MITNDNTSFDFLQISQDINKIENDDEHVRQSWEKLKLEKLIKFAKSRSLFWKNRLPNNFDLAQVPILDRVALRHQINSEGSLINPIKDGTLVRHHKTGGSSENPLIFYVTKSNANYNLVRSTAQYFIENRDINLNRVDVKIEQQKLGGFGFKIKQDNKWGGAFSNFKTGTQTLFTMYKDTDSNAYLNALNKIGVNGYYSTNPRTSKILMNGILNADIDIKYLGIKYYINRGDRISDFILSELQINNVNIRNTYSCEEVGPIGYSCPLKHDHYHVASSNIIVESIPIDTMDANRLIVTGLNSFATPFIKYDIGDIGEVREGCECGWKGQVIFNLEGRRTGVLRSQDGSMVRVKLTEADLYQYHFKDVRIRQYEYSSIKLEYVRNRSLKSFEERRISDQFCQSISKDINIEFVRYDKIDWGTSYKRHFFRCEI